MLSGEGWAALGPRSDAELKNEYLVFGGPVTWSSTKGLRTGCPLLLFSIAQRRHRAESQVSVSLFGQSTARPYRWVSA